MTGAEYVELMRKRIKAANADCSYDGKGGLYRVLLGDLSQAPPLSVIFVYYPVKGLEFWSEQLRNLQQQNPHLSLHIIPGSNDPGFIIRGTVGPSWVNDHLWKKTSLSLPDAVIALDLAPKRLRWFDVDGKGGGAMHAKDETAAKVARSHFKGSRDGSARARLIFRPPMMARTFYLLFQFEHNRDQFISGLRADERLPLRDLFLVLEKSHHQFSDKTTLKKFDDHPEMDTERKHFIEKADAMAVVEIDPAVMQLGGDSGRGPYQDLISWCQDYRAENQDEVKIKILPVETVNEGAEFADPYRAWSEQLQKVLKGDERVSVGWLPATRPDPLPPGEKPAFEMARLPTVIVGCSGSGKSWIAIHLLAQYARDGFTVVYLNYLKATPSDQPRAQCLRPYGAFVAQATDGRTKVKAVKWPALGTVIREDRKDDPSPPPDSGDFTVRPGRAYYTEFWPGHGTFEQLFGELSDQKGIVFCFDEVVNQAGDSSVKERIQILQNKGRHDHHYSVLIHQKLGDVQNKGWVDINGKCSLLLKRLDDEESRTLYQSLRVDADADFWGYDVDVKKLDQFFQVSDFAIVRPFMADTKLKPIPLQMPAYLLPANDTALNWGDEVGS
ncbi:MAG TPA: ATP-binding protein [Thermoanaerobaculia bacterium]|jgi:hypothetical protein|nr:ATP-binding protein [Thermoanaerobaculia bacterium]